MKGTAALFIIIGTRYSAIAQSDHNLRPGYLAAYFLTELPPEGLPGRFGVITAYNPNGRRAADATNLTADCKLEECLKRSKLPHFRVTGGSQDGSHREPGFGVVTGDIEEVEKLARQFRQEAFFWIEDGEIYCFEVDRPTRHRLGPWSGRCINK